MNKYLFLILLFAVLMILRFLVNFPKYLFLKKTLRKQDIFVKSNFAGTSNKEKKSGRKAAQWIEENRTEIKKVVLNTGLPNQTKSFMEPLGLGYTQKQSMSVLSNLTYLNTEILKGGRQLLNSAKGHYKNQSIKCFNPLFWIEFVIFLPREIFNYFSIDKNIKFGSTLINIFQLIYWIVSIIFMYLEYIK